jgi:invasion protein IalB
MQQKHAIYAAAALLLAALTAAPDSAAAQEIAAWRVECTGDGKTLDCRAVQQLFQRDTRGNCWSRYSCARRPTQRPR